MTYVARRAVWLTSVALFFLAPLALADPTRVFVDAGQALEVHSAGGDWSTEGDALVAAGTGRYLFAPVTLANLVCASRWKRLTRWRERLEAAISHDQRAPWSRGRRVLGRAGGIPPARSQTSA